MSTIDPFEQNPSQRANSDAKGLFNDSIDAASQVSRPPGRTPDSGESWSASRDGLLSEPVSAAASRVGTDGWPVDTVTFAAAPVSESYAPVSVETASPTTFEGRTVDVVPAPVVLRADPVRPVRAAPPSSLADPVVVARSERRVTVAPRSGRRYRPRVRKVTRVLRRIDPWSVFKISLIMYSLLYLVIVIAGVLLWRLAFTTGTIENIQGFIREAVGLKKFELNGTKLFRSSWILGIILTIGGTGLHVTLAIMFNLITDLVGGVRLTVLEEEVLLQEPAS